MRNVLRYCPLKKALVVEMSPIQSQEFYQNLFDSPYCKSPETRIISSRYLKPINVLPRWFFDRKSTLLGQKTAELAELYISVGVKAVLWIRIRIKFQGRIRIRINVIRWIRIHIHIHQSDKLDQFADDKQNERSLFEHFFKVLSLYLEAKIRIRSKVTSRILI